MLMDNLPKKLLCAGLYFKSFHATKNLSELRAETRFWFQIISNVFLSFSFFNRDRRQMYTICRSHLVLFPPSDDRCRSAARGPRILDDLVSTHFLARFVYFHFLSFVYISAHNSVLISVLRHPPQTMVRYCKKEQL